MHMGNTGTPEHCNHSEGTTQKAQVHGQFYTYKSQGLLALTFETPSKNSGVGAPPPNKYGEGE